MLTRTTELAVQSILYLTTQKKQVEPLSPKQIARVMGCSPSYLAKTLSHLVKAGILRSIRGVHGGVVLARRPAEISLLDIVEACQGLLTASYCVPAPAGQSVCSFHLAMKQLHEAIRTTLEGWTVADLLEHPARCGSVQGIRCKMYFEGCEELMGEVLEGSNEQTARAGSRH